MGPKKKVFFLSFLHRGTCDPLHPAAVDHVQQLVVTNPSITKCGAKILKLSEIKIP